VVADLHIEMSEYFDRFREAFESTREEIAPLLTLPLGLATVGEMDHLSHIGIIPAPEWDAWDEVFVIDQSESLRRKKTAVVVAKIVQPNTRLTESVDSTDWADDVCRAEARRPRQLTRREPRRGCVL
jgi:hypothetical protein